MIQNTDLPTQEEPPVEEDMPPAVEETPPVVEEVTPVEEAPQEPAGGETTVEQTE